MPEIKKIITSPATTDPDYNRSVSAPAIPEGSAPARINPIPTVRILDAQGNPLRQEATAFKAGSPASHELAGWNPAMLAPHVEAQEYPLITSRTRDLRRNNGYVSGAVESAKDNIVGPSYRLSLKPRYRMLGISHDTANEWASMVEERFHAWADDSECWIDARRKMTFAQLLRYGVSSDLINGETFLARQWRPDVRTPFATCFSIIEPERVSNPMDRQISKPDRLSQGVETDRFGAAVAYYVRKKHPGDHRGASYYGYGSQSNDKNTWQRLGKTNNFGWRQVLHVFDADRGDQQRGQSRFASTVQKIKMLDRYEDVTLEASILAATYAMVVKSELGANSIFDALSPNYGMKDAFSDMMGMKLDYREKGLGDSLTWNGAKIPHLFPGESLESIKSQFPTTSFAEFEQAMQREIARGFGTSYEQYTGDFSKTTYSSARTAMLEMYKAVTGKRSTTTDKLANGIFGLWLDEAIAKGEIEPPAGVSDYWSNKTALTNCTWIAAGRGEIDPLKSAKANQVKLQTGETTMQAIAAENGGDWQENMEQISREVAMKMRIAEANGIVLTDEMKARMLGIGAGSDGALVFGASE